MSTRVQVGEAARDPQTGGIAQLVAQQTRFLAFLRRRLGDTAAAEDVLQSAYVKALRSQTALRDRSSVVRWFFQILKRSVVDHHRHARAGARLHAARESAALASERDGELRAAVCACVESLLPSLPPEQAEMLHRVDLGGATVAESAAILGITPGHAAVRIHRARRALRAKLEAVCGACTRHHCLDCQCRPRARNSRRTV